MGNPTLAQDADGQRYLGRGLPSVERRKTECLAIMYNAYSYPTGYDIAHSHVRSPPLRTDPVGERGPDDDVVQATLNGAISVSGQRGR